MRSLFSGGLGRVVCVPVYAGTVADLATAFGLTLSEQRLCEMLLLGHSLKEAADMLGIASERSQRLQRP